MHLTAEQLIMLRDLRIDSQAIGVSKSLSYLCYLVVRHFSHRYIRRGKHNSESNYFDSHLNTHHASEVLCRWRYHDVDCSTCAKPTLHVHCSCDPCSRSGLFVDRHDAD